MTDTKNHTLIASKVYDLLNKILEIHYISFKDSQIKWTVIGIGKGTPQMGLVSATGIPILLRFDLNID